jgi:hypothetical protein
MVEDKGGGGEVLKGSSWLRAFVVDFAVVTSVLALPVRQCFAAATASNSPRRHEATKILLETSSSA